MYKFRFGSTKKTIHLKEKQVRRIPYLYLRIQHGCCVQNENGEYVLNSKIHYTWFTVIIDALFTGNISVLFTKLPQEANILRVLQLYDYLWLDPIPVPFLKDQHLVRLNTVENVNDNRHVEYHLANFLEARDTAVQFLISLTKNKYNLDDSQTLESVFSLLKSILTNPNVFSDRLCHHTFTIIEKYCFPWFSPEQQWRLCKAQQSAPIGQIHSSMDLHDDEQSRTSNSQNVFAWKGVYVPIEEKKTNLLSIYNKDMSFSDLFPRYYSFSVGLSISRPSQNIEYKIFNSNSLIPSFTWEELLFSCYEALQIDKNDQKKIEADSARSGRFNTLPKRPKVDKFKHRCGPKAQKYR